MKTPGHPIELITDIKKEEIVSETINVCKLDHHRFSDPPERHQQEHRKCH